MKKTSVVLSLLFFVFTVTMGTVQAQKTDKQLKKELNAKVGKQVRKEAKRMKKDGWQVNPGTPPLEKLLEKAQMRTLEEDEKGNPKYIMADGNGIGGNKTAAEMAAVETGKLLLAGQLETRVSALISANIANTELSDQEAESINEVVASSKNIIAKNLGFINPVFKVFRRLENGNVEVQVRLSYNSEEAEAVAKKAIKAELKDKLKTNEEDLKKLMGM